MRVVILAGGKGTRISEETSTIPKPMLSIGDKPILHHIMDIFMKYGHNDFLIAAGYKKQHILAYFLSLGVDCLEPGDGSYHMCFDGFTVRIVDTGSESMTGGRLKRLAGFLNGTFMMTYGDGLANVNLDDLLKTHRDLGRSVTVTAVRPVPRFGSLSIEEPGVVTEFSEKMIGEGDWINGGFFVIEPAVLDYIRSDDVNWEKEVLPRLAIEGRLSAYRHNRFWHCIDTLRDLQYIREEYERNGAVWLR